MAAPYDPTRDESRFKCYWCPAMLLFRTNEHGQRIYPAKCPTCGMNPHPALVDETVGGKVDPAKVKATSRARRSAPALKPLNLAPVGKPVLGVDPGAKYVGVVLRDGDAVLHASTLVRPNDMNPTDWAKAVVIRLRKIEAEFDRIIPVGVEGVRAPGGFDKGQRAPLNPRDIIFAGIVLGGVVVAWPDAVVIPPGRNGSQHVTHYPPALVGRRPADLPGSTNGAGTRDHEQSAYDVAGKAARIIYPAPATSIEGLTQR